MLDIFNKSKDIQGLEDEKDLTKIAALLIHAAKIDDNYSDKEKLIIVSFLKSIGVKKNIEEIIKKAEIEETQSNQILR